MFFAYNIGVTSNNVGLREGLHLEYEARDKYTWVPMKILNGFYFGTQDSTQVHFFVIDTILKLKFGRMKASWVAHVTQFTVWQKDQNSSRYSFPKFTVSLMKRLRVSVEGF